MVSNFTNFFVLDTFQESIVRSSEDSISLMPWFIPRSFNIARERSVINTEYRPGEEGGSHGAILQKPGNRVILVLSDMLVSKIDVGALDFNYVKLRKFDVIVTSRFSPDLSMTAKNKISTYYILNGARVIYTNWTVTKFFEVTKALFFRLKIRKNFVKTSF